jgi:hypothetical protein
VDLNENQSITIIINEVVNIKTTSQKLAILTPKNKGLPLTWKGLPPIMCRNLLIESVELIKVLYKDQRPSNYHFN